MAADIRRSLFGQRLQGWLASPRLPLFVAGLAVALTLPALSVGWQLDDHFQRLVMLESDASGFSAMHSFSALRDPAVNRRYVDLGYLPWWTPEGFRLAFFRPLSIATAWLDYRLWPDSAVLMHAHSLLWFALLVMAAAFLYRRFFVPVWVGGLAALLYAVDEAHAGAAAWLANRNALLATLFGVVCLLAHERWRRAAWKPGAWIAPCLLALGLMAGEAALAIVGYLFAFAVFLEPGPRRLRSLLPYATVLAAWVALYRIGGYGVWGSGLYLDPLHSPLAYGEALLQRVPFFLLGQWTPLPADLGGLLAPAAARRWWLLAVAVVLVVLAALWPLLRRDRQARFWGLGMLLSLLPIAATFPSNRLLFFVGLGAMGLLARFLQTTLATRDPEAGRGQGLRRALAWALVVAHLVLAPLLMPLAPRTVRQMGEPMQAAAASLGSDPRLATQELVIATTPDYLMFVSNLPTLQALAARPVPRRLRALAAGPTAVELNRIDARTLRVDLERGLFSGPLGYLFRDPRLALPPGQTVRIDDVEIEVVALATDGSPGALLYRFALPLEDPSMRWVHWRDGRYVPFEPPAVGHTLALPAAFGPFDRLGW